MHNNATLVFFALLFFSSFASAEDGYTITNPVLGQYTPSQDVGDPKLVGSLDAEITQNWRIEIGSQQFSDLTFITYAFANAPYQQAGDASCTCSPSACTQGTDMDNYGNKRLRFSFTPSGDEYLTCVTRVRTNYLSVSSADVSDPSKFSAYSSNTDPSPEIKSNSISMVGSDPDKTDAAVRLTGWVNNLVTYDIAYLGRTTPASQVYVERRGVCNEYSHLLMASLKAINVPVRFAAGLVYSGKEWGPHAWSEAFMDGKWRPLDGTYDEALILDATHIKLAHGIDQTDIREELQGRGINIDLSTVKIHKLVTNMRIIDRQSFPKMYSYTLTGPKKTLGEGSIAEVNVTATCEIEECPLPFLANVPAEIRITTPPSVIVYLKKGQVSTSQWKMLMPENLERGFVYIYPFELLGLGIKDQVNITARKGGEVQTLAEVSIDEVAPTILDNKLRVRVVLRNAGNRDVNDVLVVATLENFSQSAMINVPFGGTGAAEFLFNKPAAPQTPMRIYVQTAFGTLEREYLIDTTRTQVPQTPMIPEIPGITNISAANLDFKTLGLLAFALVVVIAGIAFLLHLRSSE
jgi:hypothetical protein